MNEKNQRRQLPGYRPKEWEFLCNSRYLNDFVAIGVLPAGPVPHLAAAKLNSWTQQEYHASMSYMRKKINVRYNCAHPDILPNASTVVVAAIPYGQGIEKSGIWKHIAKFARGRDYHKTMKNKLKQLAECIKNQFPKAVCRIFVDSAPLMERTLALLAGLGTLGKNGAVLVDGVGPSVLLGEIVCANVPCPPLLAPPSIFSRCGECTLCIDACPTNAIVAPGTIDSRRCLSYWSIEAPEMPSGAVASNLTQIFGCDICTSVCPHNVENISSLEAATSLVEMPQTLNELLRLDEHMIKEALYGTALCRTGVEKLKGNARVVLDNMRRY